MMTMKHKKEIDKPSTVTAYKREWKKILQSMGEPVHKTVPE